MKIFIKIIITSIAIFGIGLINVNGQDSVDSIQMFAAEAEGAVQKYMNENKFMGVTAGFSRIGSTTWTTAKGYSNANTKEGMVTQTKMRTASIAKPMTAVAIMQLVEQDLIDLDVPVQTYIPNYPKKKKGKITTRHLLNQTSGTRAYAFWNEANSTKNYTNLAAAVDVFKNRKLKFKPGTKFHYTTYGYVVLGLIIEKVSGLTYEAYMTKNIWEKAGMVNTGVEKYQSQYANKSSLYRRNRMGKIKLAKENNLSNRVPGGGFYSTVGDLLRFGEAIINNELISAESLALMLEKSAVGKRGNQYGFGWFLYGSKGYENEAFGHSGGQRGTSTQLMIIPSKGVVAAVMSNTSGAYKEVAGLSVDLIEIMKIGNREK